MSIGAIYPATWTKDELINMGTEAADGNMEVALIPGQFVPIGEYVVKADELVGIGRGEYSRQNEAIGRLFAIFRDTNGSQINGKFRIMLMSSQEIPIGAKPVYIDVDLPALQTGYEIPADRYALPFDNVMLSRDKKFQFLIRVSGKENVRLSKEESNVLLDVARVIV